MASGAVLNFVGDVEARTARIDEHLTDIMMAQDFHDLTGQVVAKVVTLATDLEDSLVKLLVQVVPPEQRDEGRVEHPATARWSTPKGAPTSSPTRAKSTTCWPASASRPAGAAAPGWSNTHRFPPLIPLKSALRGGTMARPASSSP